MGRVRLFTPHDRRTGATRCVVRRWSGCPLNEAFRGATLAYAAAKTRAAEMDARQGGRMPAIAARFARSAD